jgi:hypothetical protein
MAPRLRGTASIKSHIKGNLRLIGASPSARGYLGLDHAGGTGNPSVVRFVKWFGTPPSLGAGHPDPLNRSSTGSLSLRGEGWVGDGAYLSLWSIEDVVSRNETLEAANLTPGLIFIGSDGADNLYGIELNSGRYWIFPAIGLSAEMGEEIGQSWDEFLAALSTS